MIGKIQTNARSAMGYHRSKYERDAWGGSRHSHELTRHLKHQVHREERRNAKQLIQQEIADYE